MYSPHEWIVYDISLIIIFLRNARLLFELILHNGVSSIYGNDLTGDKRTSVKLCQKHSQAC